MLCSVISAPTMSRASWAAIGSASCRLLCRPSSASAHPGVRPRSAQYRQRNVRRIEVLSTDFAHFDFGLSSDQEARAVRLHHESIVVDMLYWGPVGYRSIPEELEAQLLKCGDNPAAIELETYRLLQGQAGPAGALGYREAWEASAVTAGSRDIDLTDHRLASRSFGVHQAQFDKFDWLVKPLCADGIRSDEAAGKRARV